MPEKTPKKSSLVVQLRIWEMAVCLGDCPRASIWKLRMVMQAAGGSFASPYEQNGYILGRRASAFMKWYIPPEDRMRESGFNGNDSSHHKVKHQREAEANHLLEEFLGQMAALCPGCLQM